MVAVPGEFGIILILRVDLLFLNLLDLRAQVIAIAFEALVELIEKEYGVVLSVLEAFRRPTLRAMASSIAPRRPGYEG